jgi:hypothetical protein
VTVETWTIGVVGLGRRIAACLLSHDFRVVAFDRSEKSLPEARRHIASAIDDLVLRGGFPASLLVVHPPRGETVRLTHLGSMARLRPGASVSGGFRPGEVGAYVDPMHMTIEGSRAGWEMGLDLVAPWLALVGVKNFRWSPAGRDGHGQRRWRWQYCPLADGIAPLPEFFAYLRRLKYDGTVSLHSGYEGETSFRRLTTPELLEQSVADLRYLKGLTT